MNKSTSILKDALRILSISEVSESKLKSSLQKKGYKQEDILDVLDYLREKRFIDDIRFCTILIKKHINKEKGINYIRQLLSMHGIPENTITGILAKTYPQSLEYKVAKNFLKSLKLPFPKAILKLKTRGFSEETIEKLTEEFSSE